MDKITGITDWQPLRKQKQKPLPSLDILLGVNSRLQEILITSILSHTPHRVHVVNSGQMAITSLNQHNFDLTILSYDMPELTGTQTAKLIRSTAEAWHNIPIIGLLENQANLMMAECVASGMNCFVCPPFSAKKILSFVRYYQNKKNN